MPGATTLMVIGIAAVAVVILVIGLFVAIKQFYQVPEADEALVKTGGSSPVVSTGGGVWVIPMFHKVTRVSLQAIRVPIDRTGQNAVPSQDMIPAEIKGEMFVQVNPQDEAAIVQAVQALGTGDPNTMADRVRTKIDSQVTDALRTAAFQKTFLDLNAKKKDFADEVVKLLQEDLNRLGLMLTSVAVTHVTQGPFTEDAGDVIAAQGRRNVAETVEKNRQETNKITRNAQVTVQEQDVEAREKTLNLEFRQKQREADNDRQVKEYEAQQRAETRKQVLAQEQAIAEAEATQERAVRERQIAESEAVEAREIAKQKAIAVANAKADAERKVAEAEAREAEETARIAQEKAVEAANIARQREIEAAKIAKEQAIKVADEQRQQAVETAEVERQKAIAAARAEEAAARAEQATAEAKQRQAEEQITTVREVAEADRSKQVAIVQANLARERDQIDADKKAYVVTKNAEAVRDAAIKNAEAVKAEADGRALAQAATAKGEAEAVEISARAYATDKTVRAEADFNASEQEAAARVKLSEAILKEGEAKAEARRLEIEAENAVARELLLRDIAVKFLDVAPSVVHEIMAPVANVAHDVKILQVNGLGGNGEAGEGAGMGIPGEVLKLGLASAGALPFLREAWSSVRGDPNVGNVVEALKGALATAIADGSLVLTDSVKPPAANDNGVRDAGRNAGATTSKDAAAR